LQQQQQQDEDHHPHESRQAPQLTRPPASSSSAAAAAAGRGGAAVAPNIKSLLLLRGLLGAATVTAYYAAVEDLPLSVAVALFFFHPVLALLLNAAVTKSTVSPQAAGSCALTVLGVLVIGWHDQLMLQLEQAAVFLSDLNREGFTGAAAAAASVGDGAILGPELSLYGVVMGVIAAAANAAAFVVVGLIGREVSPLDVCWWQYCVTTHAAVAVLLLSSLEAVLVQSSAAAGFLGPELLLQLQQQQGSVGGIDNALADPLAAAAAAAGGASTAAAAASVVDLGMDQGFDLGSMGHVLQDSVLHLQLLLTDSLPSQHDALLLCGVVIANFAGQLLLNAGFQRIDAGRGAAVNTLQVLFANAWDVLLLHGQLSAAMVAGSGMIAAGVVGTQQSAAAAAPARGDGQQQHQQQQQQQDRES
jgi:drug/metabolite transporter (DMT)-like permease